MSSKRRYVVMDGEGEGRRILILETSFDVPGWSYDKKEAARVARRKYRARPRPICLHELGKKKQVEITERIVR